MLPADIARCAGKIFADDGRPFPFPEHAPECEDCQRRTDRSTFPQLRWMAATDEWPCPNRIPPEKAE